MEVIFWICLILVIYTYVGYGFLLFCLVQIKRLFRGRCVSKNLSDSDLPHITLMICAYNEEAVVEEKMRNCRALNYPNDRLHIMWVTDGTTDSTNERLAAYEEVKVVFSPERRGKTAALTHGMTEVTTPLVAFTDANTMLGTDSIRVIANLFADAKVGCVSGEKRVAAASSDDQAGQSEGLYWRYESTLKKWDSELCSTMGAAGELFAIRAELFEPMPHDTLLDDFILSMRIVQRGYRIAYSPDAYALEYGSASYAEEQKRKQRISAGGLQSIWRLRSLLLPWPRPLVSFQYVSHRVLRWSLTPLALVLLIPVNVWLVLNNVSMFYTLAWCTQLLFYFLGWIGSRGCKGLPQTIYYFIFMNLNVFRGIVYLYTHRNTGVWEKASRSATK